MAWTYSYCSARNSKNSESSWVPQFGVNNANEVMVLLVAKDNVQTTDGNTNEVTGVTDDHNSQWSKIGEFTNGQGGAAAGATIAAFWCRSPSSGTYNITITFSSAITAKVATLANFTTTQSTTGIEVALGPTTLANDGADPGSMSLTGPGSEVLYIRGIASETNSGTALTPSTNFAIFADSFAFAQTTGSGSASNMAGRGEYRIVNTSSAVVSDPTFVNADCASLYFGLRETTPPTLVNTTGVSAAVSVGSVTTLPVNVTGPAAAVVGTTSVTVVITNDVYVPVTGPAAAVTHVGVVTLPGINNPAQVTGVSVAAALSSVALTLFSPEPSFGPEPICLLLSGGTSNNLPRFSLGGVPSLAILGAVSGQTATISGTPNITGLYLRECEGNAIGDGTLTYVPTTGLLRWTRADASFDFIILGGDGDYRLGTADAYLAVRVLTSLLPTVETSDTVTIAEYPQNLFDDVDYSQWGSGVVEYRGLYLKNLCGYTINTLTVSIEQPNIGSIALALEPGAVTFGTQYGALVEKDQDIHPVDFQQWYEAHVEARTDLKNYYVPVLSIPFFYAAPKQYIASDPYSDGSGTQLLSVLDDEADSTNKLASLSWDTSITVTDFPTGYCLPFWVRRTIPASTPGETDVDDQFRLQVLYN